MQRRTLHNGLTQLCSTVASSAADAEAIPCHRQKKKSCERKEFPPSPPILSRDYLSGFGSSRSVRRQFLQRSGQGGLCCCPARCSIVVPTDRPCHFFLLGEKGRRGWRMGENFCFECCDTTHAPRVSYCMGGHCTVGVCPGIERGREGGRPK